MRLREWLIDKAHVDLLGDYRAISVFPNVTVLPIIISASRCDKADLDRPIAIEHFEDLSVSNVLTTSIAVWKEFPDFVFNLSISKDDIPIMKTIERVSAPLTTMADVKFGVKVYQRGKGDPPQTGEEAEPRLFESDRQESDEYYPYIRGKYVTAWHINMGRAWIRYGKHLAEPRTFDLFTGPRVLVRRIVGDRLVVVPTQATLIADQLLHTVKPKKSILDYRYIAA